MTRTEFQRWLNQHGASIAEDGIIGPASRAAVSAVFSNLSAPAITDAELTEMASRLGCSLKQLRAVATVESGGSGFDKQGRPKILFERHYFHRLTNGEWSTTSFSNPKGGGYAEDSWAKLAAACAKDPWAAFQSCSWGKFQIMGSHWRTLGYLSPLSMAWMMRQDEYGHYDALVRFIEANGLRDEMARLSSNPDHCRAFARAYNGPQYERFSYHEKLARAMA